MLGAGVLVAACTGGPGDGADRPAPGSRPPSGGSVPSEYTGDDFYAVPDPLPTGEHGDLVRYERIDDAVDAAATHWRVMYLSESVPGDAIAVTGTVVVPATEAPAGGRDIVTVGHGTTGIADTCAPSLVQGEGEDGLAALAAEAGQLLAISDYEGLGTPGRHPYLVGESEARSLLDAARAAGQVPGAAAGDRLAIAGYSQGGHAALWAAELADRWTPELEVVGTFAGAPASDLAAIPAAAGSTPIAGFVLMIVAGFEAAYPEEADPALVLTPDGVANLGAVDDGCVTDVIASAATPSGGPLVQRGAGSTGPWAELLAANEPGQVATDAPVLVVHSETDEIVPVAFSERLAERMCGQGQQVERRVLTDGMGHSEAAAPAYVAALDWIADRFAGEPPVSTCA